MATDDTPPAPEIALGDAETAAAEPGDGGSPPSETRATGEAAHRSPSQQRLAETVGKALFSDGGDPLAPGSVFAGRYRIEQRLGQGGMGEVFRAHDMVLGEDVALKLLPPSLAARPGYYERFVREVRLARQVSHPSLCRVHDIGESEGQPFLSMEYVDGEDLQSLLRRIGRLGGEKALELSHQLCAGLAALHERGIIHRDLKPANIMLDGNGRIRIADFGLASIAAELGDHEVRDGTPAYQAPEQRDGREATTRSDVFALGLVLHEMHVGSRPSRTGSRASSPSDTGLDAGVEAVIEQCLAEDPDDRFVDALQVLVALPGGDPLAAALAAGRLPSPDAVANARVVGGLSPLVTKLLVAGLVLCLGALAILNPIRSALALDDGLLSPDVLRDRVAQKRESLNIGGSAGDVVHLGYRTAWISHFEGEDDPVSAARQSEESLLSFTLRGFGEIEGHGTTQARSVPVADEGDLSVRVDGRGRLLGLHWNRLSEEPSTAGFSYRVAGDQPEEPTPQLETAEVWERLFAAAEIEGAAMTPAPAEFIPPVHGDALGSWTGSIRGNTVEMRAASSRGHPVWLSIRTDAVSVEENVLITGWPAMAFFFLTVGGVAVLIVCFRIAISTVRRKEGDFKGARRVGVLVVVLELCAWVLAAPVVEWIAVADWVLRALGLGVATWLGYLMLEPYARAHWPKTLVSWSRLLRGRWRDPMVGRDLLVGVAGGCLMPLLFHADPSSLFTEHDLELLMGVRHVLAWLPGTASLALQATFCLYVALLGLHRLVRVRALALALFLAFVPALALVLGFSLGTTLAILVAGGLAAFIMLRFGVLAMAFFAFASWVALSFPITVNFGAWYAATGAVGAAILLAMGISGARLCSAPLRADRTRVSLANS